MTRSFMLKTLLFAFALGFIGTEAFAQAEWRTPAGAVTNNINDVIYRNRNVGIGQQNPLTQLDVRRGNIFNSRTPTPAGVVPRDFVALGIAGNGAPNACPIYGMAAQDIDASTGTTTLMSVGIFKQVQPIVYWQQNDLRFQAGCGNNIVTFKDNGLAGFGTENPLTGIDVRSGNIFTSPSVTGPGVVPGTFAAMGIPGNGAPAACPIYGFAAQDEDGSGATTLISMGIYKESQPAIFWQQNDLAFQAGCGNDIVTFKDNGQVGIGTSNPLTGLDVRSGNIFTSPTVTGPGVVPNQFAALGIAGNGAPGACPVYGLGVAENGTVFSAGTKNAQATIYWNQGDLAFESGCNNEVLTILNNGNVGIGNTNPSALLDVGTTTGARIEIGSVEFIEDGGSVSLILGNANIRPDADNLRDIGTSAFRWDDVWATNGMIQTSDRRDKENITEITYGMDEILQLRPVSFTWKDRPDNGTKLGLIAQEVDAVIDEVVKQDFKFDEEGNEYKVSDRYGLYYSDLIPVLIKALQEEHAKVADLEERLAMLENGNMDPSSKSGNGASANDILNGDLEKAELFQNVPNPFNIDTRIDYILPENVKSASLYIYNMNGQQMREINNLELGKSSVTVEGATLEAGMYFYSLIADGQEVATKRMILTK